jgi:hypothetical protein
MKENEPIEYLGTYGKSTVPIHYTHKVLDSTKVRIFQECPRHFFYEHILGWQQEKSVHLVFGSAWHDAMEHLMHHGHGQESVLEAFKKFLDTWEENDGPMFDHPSKNPHSAMRALATYAKTWRWNPEDLLYTELAGPVPLDDEKHRQFYVKFDAVFNDPTQGICSLEHKTTGRLTNQWREQWHTDVQMLSYQMALRLLYNDQQFGAVIINGAVFRTKDFEFLRIPTAANSRMIAQHNRDLNYWFDVIDWNLEMLAECSPSDSHFDAFHRNPANCAKWGCKFQSICHNVPNPLQRLDEPPYGTEVRFWDPTREAKHSLSEIKEL